MARKKEKDSVVPTINSTEFDPNKPYEKGNRGQAEFLVQNGKFFTLQGEPLVIKEEGSK